MPDADRRRAVKRRRVVTALVAALLAGLTAGGVFPPAVVDALGPLVGTRP